MKALKESTRKSLWRTFLICTALILYHILHAIFSIPEWDPGYFYLFEGQVRVLLPFMLGFLALFLIFLVYDLRLSRREMAERERYYEQRNAEREKRQ